MGDTMQRVCFVMYLKPDRVDDYLAVHEHVWSEMLDALRESGWRNYSLILRPTTGWSSEPRQPISPAGLGVSSSSDVGRHVSGGREPWVGGVGHVEPGRGVGGLCKQLGQVGGGSQNRLLCQLTADRLRLPVLAGPVEAPRWAMCWSLPAPMD